MTEDGYIRFEWDERKADSNRSKHKVTFEEASTVFTDPYARVIEDPDHSDEEERFIILGMSMRARELVVCHCLRNGGSTIRIISARRAESYEREQYWRFRHEG